MLKRTALAIILTLIPLFTAVTTVNAATYYSIFDIFRYLAALKPPTPPTVPTITIQETETTTISLIPTSTATPTPTTLLTQTPTPTLTPTPTTSNVPTNTPTLTPSPTESPLTPTPTRVLSATDDHIKTYIMNEINSYRKSHGLYEVKTDQYACDFAKIRAKEVSSNFNHEGFNNRINSKTLPYPTYSKITENIAMNSNYLNVVGKWKNSAGHAANMRADTPFVCVEKYGNYYAYEGWKP